MTDECFLDYTVDKDACVVFIYTWRRREILEQCIDSMIKNPGYPMRLWVVDNGNCDGSREYLLSKVYEGHIEKLIIEKRNWGIWYPLNECRALLHVTSIQPYIPKPKYFFLSNDDMIVKVDNWLKILVDSFEELKNCPYKIGILSPFHCKRLDGNYADSMTPEDYWNGYPISTYVSGNTWFVDTDLFLSMPDFPVDNSIEMGDWFMLDEYKKRGYKCVRTKEEILYHHPDTQQFGKYNYLRHW